MPTMVASVMGMMAMASIRGDQLRPGEREERPHVMFVGGF